MQISILNITLPVASVSQKDKKTWDELFDYGKKIGKKMGIKRGEDLYKILKSEYK